MFISLNFIPLITDSIFLACTEQFRLVGADLGSSGCDGCWLDMMSVYFGLYSQLLLVHWYMDSNLNNISYVRHSCYCTAGREHHRKSVVDRRLDFGSRSQCACLTRCYKWFYRITGTGVITSALSLKWLCMNHSLGVPQMSSRRLMITVPNLSIPLCF